MEPMTKENFTEQETETLNGLIINRTNERLNLFFKESIDAVAMAKNIRRVNYILALTAIRESDDNPINKKWLDDGYFWLNELAEVLDPNIDVD